MDRDRIARYVLGELRGAECAAFEARLAREPALREAADVLARVLADVQGIAGGTPRCDRFAPPRA